MDNVDNFRWLINNCIMTVLQHAPCVGRHVVTEKTLHCRSTDGTPLALHQFMASMRKAQKNTSPAEPAVPDKPPAILYLHGGGFMAGSTEVFRHEAMWYMYAKQSQLDVFAREYSTASRRSIRSRNRWGM